MQAQPISLVGHVAVITGAGAGLGRAYALAFARRGASVLVNDLGATISGAGSSVAAQEVVDEITAEGGIAASCNDTVSTLAGGQAIIDAAIENFGRVDILVNNAGIVRNGGFDDLAEGDIDDVLAVHLRGAFNVTRPAYRVMAEQGYGRVLLTGSGAAMFGREMQSNYTAAKGGVFGLLRGLAPEAVRHGVLVNAILPVALTRLAQGHENAVNGMVMRGRPDLVAPLATYLVSEACTVSGQAFSAFDGHFARVVVSTSPGWNSAHDHEPTAEDIAAHLLEICDPAGAWEPDSVEDEIAAVTRARQAFAAPVSAP